RGVEGVSGRGVGWRGGCWMGGRGGTSSPQAPGWAGLRCSRGGWPNGQPPAGVGPSIGRPQAEGFPVRKTAAAILSVSLTLAAFAAAPPARVPAEWLKLIDRLGDDDHDVRKAAQEKLTGPGEGALPALRRAERGHDDPDVRLWAALLVSTIEGYGEVRRFTGHTEGVINFAVSPDGKRFVSGTCAFGTEHVARVWDLLTGKELFQLKGH